LPLALETAEDFWDVAELDLTAGNFEEVPDALTGADL